MRAGNEYGSASSGRNKWLSEEKQWHLDYFIECNCVGVGSGNSENDCVLWTPLGTEMHQSID